MGTLLSVSELSRFYEVGRTVFSLKKETIRAVDGVSFDLEDGHTLGIVGESGSGKSTLARCIAFLEAPDKGKVRFMGKDWIALGQAERRAMRRHMGIIFQDPYSSLNPRKRVAGIVSEPLTVQGAADHRGDLRAKAAAVLRDVGLGEDFLEKYPHEMSGGQRQRIAIARALCTTPRFVIADEPVSALDVSVQAQIINLFLDLKEKLRFAMLFISHDLKIVRFVSDEIMVMYGGKVVEIAEKEEIFRKPLHPYTQMLMGAGKSYNAFHLPSQVPSGESSERGCPFFSRCPAGIERCRTDRPVLSGRPHHQVACFLTQGQLT